MVTVVDLENEAEPMVGSTTACADRLAVVVPVYKEERTVAELLRRFEARPCVSQIIIVDDPTTGRTKEMPEAGMWAKKISTAKWKQFPLLLWVLFALLVPGCGADPQQSLQSQHPVPVLRIDDAFLGCGEVMRTDRFVWTIPVENSSPRVVQVDKLRGDCKCLSVEPSTFQLAPGEKLNVQMALDLRGKSSEPGNLFSVQLVAEIGEFSRSQVWVIRGQVVDVFKEKSAPLSFHITEDRSVASHVERQVLFPIHDIEISAEPALVEVTHSLEGSTLTFACRDSDNCPSGRNEFNLRLTAVASDGKPVSTVVPCVINKDAVHSSVPSTASIGTVVVGESAEQEICIRFRRTCIELRAVSADPTSEFTVTVPSLKPEFQSAIVTCSVKGARPGFRFGSVICMARFGNENEVKVSIPVSYYGRAVQDVAQR